MTVQGQITAMDLSRGIKTRYVFVDRSGSESFGMQGETSADGHYTIDAVDLSSDVFIKFYAPGYYDAIISTQDLSQTNGVILTKKGGSLVPVLALAAIALLANKKKKKAIGKLATKDITPVLLIGGSVIAFTVVKKILESLGIWTDADTRNLDNAATDPASFWNPNYWRLKPPGVPFTYVIDQATAQDYASEIYDAFGAFNDCEECAKAVFRKLRTKANVSYLAEIFSSKYGQDLLNFLRGGWWPQDRLSDADVNEVNNFLKALPNY